MLEGWQQSGAFHWPLRGLSFQIATLSSTHNDRLSTVHRQLCQILIYKLLYYFIAWRDQVGKLKPSLWPLVVAHLRLIIGVLDIEPVTLIPSHVHLWVISSHHHRSGHLPEVYRSVIIGIAPLLGLLHRGDDPIDRLDPATKDFARLARGLVWEYTL